MIDVLHFYVTFLCFLPTLWRALPAPANQVLGFIAGGYAAPTALMLATLARWFEGSRTADRLANQRAVLRGLFAALAAWGLAALAGLALRQVLSTPTWEYTVGGWACWLGPPCPSPAAAAGFALAAGPWRRNWRWGLALCLATGLWATAQVCYGLRYPLDVVAGAALGAGLAWLLEAATWLERPLDALIRLARHLMLA